MRLGVEREADVALVGIQCATAGLLQVRELRGQLPERFHFGLRAEGFDLHGASRLDDFLVGGSLGETDVGRNLVIGGVDRGEGGFHLGMYGDKAAVPVIEERLKEKGLALVLTDEAKKFVIKKGSNTDFGARPLRRAIEGFIEDPLSEEMLKGEFQGINDFEVVAFLVVLPEAAAS